jgi:hypothetical protein
MYSSGGFPVEKLYFGVGRHCTSQILSQFLLVSLFEKSVNGCAFPLLIFFNFFFTEAIASVVSMDATPLDWKGPHKCRSLGPLFI